MRLRYIALWLGIPAMLLSGYVAWTCFSCHRVQASAPPDRLQVIRTLETPSFNNQPGQWSITDAATVQSVARAIDAMPVPPQGNRFCLTTDGSTFHLIFWQKQTVVLQAIVPGGGCNVVTLSKCDERQMDGAFVLRMEHLLGTDSF